MTKIVNYWIVYLSSASSTCLRVCNYIQLPKKTTTITTKLLVPSWFCFHFIIQYPFLSCRIIFSLRSLCLIFMGLLCVYLSSIYFSILPTNVIIFLLWANGILLCSQEVDTGTRFTLMLTANERRDKNTTMSQRFWDIAHKITTSDHDPSTKETNAVKPLCLSAPGRVLRPQQRKGELCGPCTSLSGGEDWGDGWVARVFPAAGREQSALYWAWALELCQGPLEASGTEHPVCPAGSGCHAGSIRLCGRTK